MADYAEISAFVATPNAMKNFRRIIVLLG